MPKSKIGLHFWNDSWRGLSFERYYGVEKYLANNRKLNGLFSLILSKGNRKVLEIGCARAKQLIYFAKAFGYRVTGIDMLEDGVESARSNLRIAHVDGEILCEDIFNTALPKESFDVVYSMGLVEHFDEIGGIVDAHIKMLKHGGTLIITVPNFRGSLYLSLCRLFGNRDWILKNHNLETMNKDIWHKILEDRKMKAIFVDYFGVVDATLSFGMVRFKPLLYPLVIINQAVGYATYYLRSNAYLSPYLVIIASKE